MLTSRGWWYLLFIFALLAAGLLGQFAASALYPRESVRLTNLLSVVLLGLTLGLWFAWEWLLFAVRAGRARHGLSVLRSVSDDRGCVETLWAGRTFQVQTDVIAPVGLKIAYGILDDRVPFGVEFVTGSARYEGEIDSAKRISINYMIRCPAAGLVRFEGIRAQYSDLQGFFYRESFLPASAVFRVLPPLADIRGHSPSVKRTNLLPPPGQHRHRRPGSGSELLDLRDYVVGDPPKTIAWKVSARRDRLITKEFESEVPLRCTLFVDKSNSVRLGPPGQNALAGLVQIGAAVAQACAGTRDLVGLCLFDEESAAWTPPTRGARHLVEIMNTLTGAAALALRQDMRRSIVYFQWRTASPRKYTPSFYIRTLIASPSGYPGCFLSPLIQFVVPRRSITCIAGCRSCCPFTGRRVLSALSSHAWARPRSWTS